MKLLLVLSISLFLTQCSSGVNSQQADKSGENQSKTVQTASKDSIEPGSNSQANEENLKPLDPKDIGTPLQSIKDLDQMVEGYHLGQNLSEQQLNENRDLKSRIIRGTFDIKELCRLSLGKHWETLNPDQQGAFVDMMTKLLETKAIFSKEQLRGDNKLYTINYKTEKFDDKQKKKATVKSEMIVPKEKMRLDITYKMLLSQYGWKIFDVIVDDASLLSNYKFQFDRIISKNGFDDLMDRMKTKLKKISTPKKTQKT